MFAEINDQKFKILFQGAAVRLPATLEERLELFALTSETGKVLVIDENNVIIFELIPEADIVEPQEEVQENPKEIPSEVEETVEDNEEQTKEKDD
jgi:hypothetical protein